MKVVLERSGGFVGRPVRRGLDTADLPVDEAARLRALATHAVEQGAEPDAGTATAAGADRFTYTLEVDRPDGRAVRTFSEPVPDDVRSLVAMLRKAPLLPARR
jgi:hypothetical protein